MKLYLVKYTCHKCETEFKSPHLIENSYGQFLLRTDTPGSLACLDAMSDKTYDEVDSIIKKLVPSYDIKVLYKVYGNVACDPDSHGKNYEIGKKPSCPSCHEKEVPDWEGTYPEEYIEMDVKNVTHNEWKDKSHDEKIQLVADFLSKI